MEPSASLPKIHKMLDRVLIEEKGRYTKRELTEEEYTRRSNGRVVYPYWMRERIQNEADAIAFIAANTTIPVPKCRLYEKSGLLHLETMPVPGIELDEVDEENKPAAVEAVTRQMNENILPQLRKLRRHFIGCVNPSLSVLPPPRIYHRDRRHWKRVTSAQEQPAFVFCHNDLSNRNIFVDPTTFQITGIIDWEFAGYFPSEWELPLWPLDGIGRARLNEEVERRDLALFGLAPKDLSDGAEERHA